MTRGLVTLIRLSRRQVDDKRRQQADLERMREQLQAKAAALDAEIAAERRLAAGSLELAQTYAAFAEGARNRQAVLARSIADVETAIATAMEELAAAFQELKRYEIAHEREEARIAATRASRQQQQLDEIALDQHRRRRAELG